VSDPRLLTLDAGQTGVCVCGFMAAVQVRWAADGARRDSKYDNAAI
jgi:hypothetical protein